MFPIQLLSPTRHIDKDEIELPWESLQKQKQI